MLHQMYIKCGFTGQVQTSLDLATVWALLIRAFIYLSSGQESRGNIQTRLDRCPVNPHFMYIWCNIHLFMYHQGRRTLHTPPSPQTEASLRSALETTSPVLCIRCTPVGSGAIIHTQQSPNHPHMHGYELRLLRCYNQVF
jgi:hypothetical protein